MIVQIVSQERGLVATTARASRGIAAFAFLEFAAFGLLGTCFRSCCVVFSVLLLAALLYFRITVRFHRDWMNHFNVIGFDLFRIGVYGDWVRCSDLRGALRVL